MYDKNMFHQALRIFYFFLIVELLMILLYNLIPRFPRIPGDINLEKVGIRIYIPFISAIVLTVFLTLILNFLNF